MGAPTVRPSRLVRPGPGTISTAGTGPLAPSGRVSVPLMWALPAPVNGRTFSIPAVLIPLAAATGSSEPDPPPPPEQAVAARANPAATTIQLQRRRSPTAPMSARPGSTPGARPGGARHGVGRPGLGDGQQQVVEGVALQALLLHEGMRHLVEHGPVGGEHGVGPRLGLPQGGLDLVVDLAGDALGVADAH